MPWETEPVEADPALSTTGRLAHRVRRRMPAVVALVTALVLGNAYVVMWATRPVGPFTTWLAPSDLWGTYLASVQLVHGHLSPAYAAYPGILLIFAPAAVVGSIFSLEVGPTFGPFAAPTGWVLMGPIEIALASVAVFACDAVAQTFGVPRGRRFVLALAEAAVLSSLTIKWGHPEDALAVGLVIYATLEAAQGGWRRSGWLLGVAIVVQPLALLAVPALATAAAVARPRRQIGALAVRAVIPGLLVMVPALIADWGQLSYWLLHQPNYPAYNHTTPFTALSPVILYQGFYAVSGGPARVVALGLSVVMGVLLCRHRPSLQRLLFVLTVVFFVRVLFESVLDAYYTWPVLALALVLAARATDLRFGATIAVSLFATWFSNLFWIGVWPWWGIMMGVLAVLMALCWPGPEPATSGRPDLAEVEAGRPTPLAEQPRYETEPA